MCVDRGRRESRESRQFCCSLFKESLLERLLPLEESLLLLLDNGEFFEDSFVLVLLNLLVSAQFLKSLLLLLDNGELSEDSFVLVLLVLVISQKKFLVTILQKERSDDRHGFG